MPVFYGRAAVATVDIWDAPEEITVPRYEHRIWQLQLLLKRISMSVRVSQVGADMNRWMVAWEGGKATNDTNPPALSEF